MACSHDAGDSAQTHADHLRDQRKIHALRNDIYKPFKPSAAFHGKHESERTLTGKNSVFYVVKVE